MADKEQLQLLQVHLPHHQNLLQVIRTARIVPDMALQLAIHNKTQLQELMGLVDTVSNFHKQITK
jgi:hypothetical protein